MTRGSQRKILIVVTLCACCMWVWGAYEGAKYAKSGIVIGIFPNSPWVWLYIIDIILFFGVGLGWVLLRRNMHEDRADAVARNLSNMLNAPLSSEEVPAGNTGPDNDITLTDTSQIYIESASAQNMQAKVSDKNGTFNGFDTAQESVVESLAQLPESSLIAHATYDWVLGGLRRDLPPIVHEPTEFEKRIIASEQTPLDPPPTPEEMHEAEMNPWVGHTTRETILRNRGQLPSGSQGASEQYSPVISPQYIPPSQPQQYITPAEYPGQYPTSSPQDAPGQIPPEMPVPPQSYVPPEQPPPVPPEQSEPPSSPPQDEPSQ